MNAHAVCLYEITVGNEEKMEHFNGSNHNKGQRIKYWSYKTKNKNGQIVHRCLRAYYRYTADTHMRKWAEEEGFTIIEFTGNGIL